MVKGSFFCIRYRPRCLYDRGHPAIFLGVWKKPIYHKTVSSHETTLLLNDRVRCETFQKDCTSSSADRKNAAKSCSITDQLAYAPKRLHIALYFDITILKKMPGSLKYGLKKGTERRKKCWIRAAQVS